MLWIQLGIYIFRKCVYIYDFVILKLKKKKDNVGGLSC